MMGLLKADFKRVFKDNLLLVLGALAVVFALITPLLYIIIFTVGVDEQTMELLAGYFTAKSQFFASFSLGNNLGLIAPVLLAIVLYKDFSYGTIRNKIIAGKKRCDVFLSLFITCSAVLTLVMLFSALITLGISLIFFDYQAEPFKMADLWYFLESLCYEILVLVFVSAVICLLIALVNNVALVIVLYVGFSFGLIMITSVVQVALTTIEVMGGNETIVSVLRFMDRINPGSVVNYAGLGSSYTLEDRLYLILPSLGWTSLAFFLGLNKFKKKEIK